MSAPIELSRQPLADVVADATPLLLSSERHTIVKDVVASLTERVSCCASFVELVRPSLASILAGDQQPLTNGAGPTAAKSLNGPHIPARGQLPLAPAAPVETDGRLVANVQPSVLSVQAAPITDAAPPNVLAGDLPRQQHGFSHGPDVVAPQRRVAAPVQVSDPDDSETSTSSDDLAIDDVTAEAGDDEEYFKDAQVVTDSFSLKRMQVPASGSGSLDSSVSSERKRGKDIAHDLNAW